MTREELQAALGNLVGETIINKAIPKNIISSEEFAGELLGFEECEDAEDEEELLNATGGADPNATGDIGTLKKIAEAIPEEEVN